MLEHKLLHLSMIRDVAFMVDPSRLVASATHLPASACDQNELEAVLRAQIINKSLDQIDEPV